MPPQRPKTLRLFLAAITRNLALDSYRRLSADRRGEGLGCLPLEELEECIAGSGFAESRAAVGELKNSIEVFLRAQGRKERSIFLRRYFFADSVSDIAERFGLSRRNVNVILFRTRKKLRGFLEKEGYFD